MKRPIVPNMRDLVLPTVFGLIISAIYFGLYSVFDAKTFKIDLSSTNITFGITFAAFSITALSLLPLLQTKEWFNVFHKLTLYDDIILNYRNSIVLNLLLFFWGLLGQLLISTLDGKFILWYNLISVYTIVFIAVYLFRNVLALIELLLFKR